MTIQDTTPKAKIENIENLRDDRATVSTIQKKILRHEHAKSKGRISSVFQYLYDFGLVGFNISVSLVIMIYIGNWLNKKYPNHYSSFMLSAIIFGFVLGAYNSYRMIKNEQQKLDREDIK